jgi:hypothetical protein
MQSRRIPIKMKIISKSRKKFYHHLMKYMIESINYLALMKISNPNSKKLMQMKSNIRINKFLTNIL